MACLDTDVLVAFLRNNLDAIKFIEAMEKEEKISATIITACELFEGASLSSRPETANTVSDLLSRITILPLSMEAAKIFGMETARLQKQGKTVEDFDLLIASIAIASHETIYTRNTKHFERINNLNLKRW